MKSSDTCVILVGHGSKARGFDSAMKRVAAALRRGGRTVRCAYLEINAPSVPGAIDRAVRSGVKNIQVLPYFLLSGRHTRDDIPREVREARKRHGGRIRITLCPYLGFDDRIVGVVKARLRG